MASGAWPTTSSGGSDGSRRARPAASGSPHAGRRLLREVEDRLPALGRLGGHLHVLRPQCRHHDRDPLADRVVDQLERLAQPGPPARWQRDRVVRAGVLQPLPPPHLPADLDDLPGPADRRVVGHPVPALDHLRTGGADAEREPAARHVVQARRGHRGQRRRPRVQLEDAGGDLQPLRPRRDEAELADRVEAVRLRHEHDVQPGLLVVGQLGHGLGEAARVVQGHPDAHRPASRQRCVAARR